MERPNYAAGTQLALEAIGTQRGDPGAVPQNPEAVPPENPSLGCTVTAPWE